MTTSTLELINTAVVIGTILCGAIGLGALIYLVATHRR